MPGDRLIEQAFSYSDLQCAQQFRISGDALAECFSADSSMDAPAATGLKRAFQSTALAEEVRFLLLQLSLVCAAEIAAEFTLNTLPGILLEIAGEPCLEHLVTTDLTTKGVLNGFSILPVDAVAAFQGTTDSFATA